MDAALADGIVSVVGEGFGLQIKMDMHLSSDIDKLCVGQIIYSLWPLSLKQ